MKINKSLDIDLNIISPQRNIRIHEGDIDSIDIVLAVSVDDVSLDLTGLTIKYDATINNYLAEQDANGSVVENKIVIPVTENMTAMPGLLLIDVRMIQGDEVLFTQTISAIVDKAVVNGSTYIDFSKITINQRLNALEEQMTYVEELVDGLDTSKQITSIYRPPQTAPATVDVDFFRVGDTWIYQDSNIVYKLIGADYNYQLGPMIPAVHKFTWQPLNERFNYGTTEPPTSATYTPIGYVIGELTFNALPVPEYFIGDTYARVISGAVETLFILTDSAEVSSGQYSFSWHENGGGDADNKMDLAPINPTAQEIAAMPSGQIYSDTVKHKGVIKGGQEFYDTEYINSHYYDDNRMRLIYNGLTVSSYNVPPTHFARDVYSLDHLWLYCPDNTLFRLIDINYASSITVSLTWQRANHRIVTSTSTAPERTENNLEYKYCAGDIWVQYDSVTNKFLNLFVCVGNHRNSVNYKTWYFSYTWVDIFQNTYTKTEIDSMIGDIETALSEV